MRPRDSLGIDRRIEPGAGTWRVAGGGITHSERTDGAARAAPFGLSGSLTWVPLPAGAEDGAAAFTCAGAGASATGRTAASAGRPATIPG